MADSEVNMLSEDTLKLRQTLNLFSVSKTTGKTDILYCRVEKLESDKFTLFAYEKGLFFDFDYNGLPLKKHDCFDVFIE